MIRLPAPQGWPRSAQALLLLALSALLVLPLQALRLPAALLLGPMAAAAMLAGAGTALRIPPPLFVAAQATVGCMIARILPPSLGIEIVHHWLVFAGGVVSVVAAAALLGTLLMRWRVLPGTTAVWGAMPGAATVMTLMSEAYGADMRLVAVMQYLRVVCAALVASLVARLWLPAGAAAHTAGLHWWAAVPATGFAETTLLAAAGIWLGRVLRIPAGPLLVPMFAGMVLKGTGLFSIVLPAPLLAVAYALLGWTIGLRFSADMLRNAAAALPRIIASILALIALCGGFAFILHRMAGVDPMTAYLATSPGGADSVAIIAAGSQVDLPFVMAMQVLRFLLVLLVGPTLARLITRLHRAPAIAPPAADSSRLVLEDSETSCP
ncbi:AbrB family transcriptional regulator [Lichenicoccus sp.]|uniref:AbrB family transcriptional regulator n=1 Tax=Lichenicoccus sp. TaxID=2781899 RepID=UPI003D116BAF